MSMPECFEEAKPITFKGWKAGRGLGTKLFLFWDFVSGDTDIKSFDSTAEAQWSIYPETTTIIYSLSGNERIFDMVVWMNYINQAILEGKPKKSWDMFHVGPLDYVIL